MGSSLLIHGHSAVHLLGWRWHLLLLVLSHAIWPFCILIWSPHHCSIITPPSRRAILRSSWKRGRGTYIMLGLRTPPRLNTGNLLVHRALP